MEDLEGLRLVVFSFFQTARRRLTARGGAAGISGGSNGGDFRLGRSPGLDRGEEPTEEDGGTDSLVPRCVGDGMLS